MAERIAAAVQTGRGRRLEQTDRLQIGQHHSIMIIAADRDQRRPRPRCLAEARRRGERPASDCERVQDRPCTSNPGGASGARLAHDQLEPIITDERELQRRVGPRRSSGSARRSTATPGRACAGSSAAAADRAPPRSAGCRPRDAGSAGRSVGSAAGHADATPSRSAGRRRAVPRRRSARNDRVDRSRSTSGRGCGPAGRFGRQDGGHVRSRATVTSGSAPPESAAASAGRPGRPAYPAGTGPIRMRSRSARRRARRVSGHGATRGPATADACRRQDRPGRPAGPGLRRRAPASGQPRPSSRSASDERVSPRRTVTVGSPGEAVACVGSGMIKRHPGRQPVRPSGEDRRVGHRDLAPVPDLGRSTSRRGSTGRHPVAPHADGPGRPPRLHCRRAAAPPAQEPPGRRERPSWCGGALTVTAVAGGGWAWTS